MFVEVALLLALFAFFFCYAFDLTGSLLTAFLWVFGMNIVCYWRFSMTCLHAYCFTLFKFMFFKEISFKYFCPLVCLKIVWYCCFHFSLLLICFFRPKTYGMHINTSGCRNGHSHDHNLWHSIREKRAKMFPKRNRHSYQLFLRIPTQGFCEKCPKTYEMHINTSGCRHGHSHDHNLWHSLREERAKMFAKRNRHSNPQLFLRIPTQRFCEKCPKTYEMHINARRAPL